MPYYEYSSSNVKLKNLPRYTSLVPHVSEFGYITGCTGFGYIGNYQDKLEFCLRISSSDNLLIQTLDQKEYINSYPHVLIKKPSGNFSMGKIDIRDVFYIIYPSEMLNTFIQGGLVDEILCWNFEFNSTRIHMINALKDMMIHAKSFGMPDKIDLMCLQLIQDLVFEKKNKLCAHDLQKQKIDKIVSFFQLHCYDIFSLDELIRQTGFSRSNFFRYWSKYYRITPSRYITNLRIEEAKRLLKETDNPVNDIALMLKFGSFTYFCEVFKSICGCTPLQYRANKKI